MSTALDIVEGDVLIVNGRDYPIRAVAPWPGAIRRSPAFARFATVTASTKRSPAMTAGTRSAPVVHLTEIKVTPLYPVDPERVGATKTETPRILLECFADGDPFLRITVEDLKV